MAQLRVASVAQGAVVVTGDPDGLVGALLTALLAEPDEGRLQVLVRGTSDALEFSGLQIRRSGSAIDLVRTAGSPTWVVTGRGGATTTIRGELIEQLFDQAYEHRRAAQTAMFPVGGRLGHGRYVITERLRGTADRGIYRASEDGSATRYLVTLGPPQQREFSELRAELALAVQGIAPLLYIGRLEPHSEAGHEGMLEVEPAGLPISAVALPLAPPVAIGLALQVARTVTAAHAEGLAIGGLRPELVYVQSAAAPIVTSIAPRAERFWATAQQRSYGVPACFDQFFLAPELLARPFDPPTTAADVFSLGAMLACWFTGEHPFEGDGTAQAISIASGRRRSWRGAAELGAIVDGALAPEPSARTSLGALMAQLETLAR